MLEDSLKIFDYFVTKYELNSKKFIIFLFKIFINLTLFEMTEKSKMQKIIIELIETVRNFFQNLFFFFDFCYQKQLNK
jgi:hypothetical protein